MPFQGAGQHGPVGRPRLVKALKQPRSKDSTVDDRPVQKETLERDAIEDALPLALAAAVEFIRMLEPQQGLRLAITGLLAEIAAWAPATVVPDECARGRGDPPARR